MSSETKEIIGLVIMLGGFILTYVPLAVLIESKWPSDSKVRLGNFGPIPKRAGIFFFVWLAVYLYLFSLIATSFFF